MMGALVIKVRCAGKLVRVGKGSMKSDANAEFQQVEVDWSCSDWAAGHPNTAGGARTEFADSQMDGKHMQAEFTRPNDRPYILSPVNEPQNKKLYIATATSTDV